MSLDNDSRIIGVQLGELFIRVFKIPREIDFRNSRMVMEVIQQEYQIMVERPIEESTPVLVVIWGAELPESPQAEMNQYALSVLIERNLDAVSQLTDLRVPYLGPGIPGYRVLVALPSDISTFILVFFGTHLGQATLVHHTNPRWISDL